MEFTTFIYYFGGVCFGVVIAISLFVVIDAIERPCKRNKRK